MALLSLLPASANAQITAGPEFRVNTYTNNAQSLAVATPRSDGSWMLTWQTAGEDGSGFGVWGKHYDRFGVIHGGEFQANTYTTGFQGAPSITTGVRSGVVVWHSLTQDGSGSGVYGQRLNATHGMLGSEFRVNSFTVNYQYDPAVSMSPGGSFVVAWSSYGQDGGANYSAIAQRFDALGNRIGAELLANTYTTGNQANVAVSADAAGNFVVVWQGSANQDGARDGIFGQRFSAAGDRLGPEFRVNTYTLNDQQYPATAMADDGTFVVVWQSLVQDGAGLGVFGQRYDAAGNRRGGELQVNAFTTNDQAAPAVGVDAEGNFVVAWESNNQDGSLRGIFGQRYDSAGNPRGTEFRVNTVTANDQFQPSIAMDRVGNFMIVWTSVGQDGSDLGTFGQRYGGLLPAPRFGPLAPMVVDPSPGNGVFEPGETVAAQPAWENVNGAAQSVTGTLSGFTGPAGASYLIADGSANYGIINPAVIQRCTFTGNCYALTVTAPQSRPVLHWDTSVVEALAPPEQGQVKRWVLHLGDSFADVPRTSVFYRFVETLLHTGVTAGCGGGNYCPGNVTTRQEMAVFVLIAKEGAGYSPPACTTPIFADVPASSPYCRWIEEMYRRGIVGGCSNNPLSYCPAGLTTREQMAVFLLRALDPAINPSACLVKPFEDVPIDSPFCRWITELVARGITGGCGGGNYCPASGVTRDQMAVFLTVTFTLQLYGS